METRGPKSNSSELLCLRSYPDEWTSMETPFSHYKSMGIFLDGQGHLTP